MAYEKTVYIFRHGETDWNRVGRMQGGTDIPLNETGRLQAARLTRFFAANPVEVFLSSDLIRAHDTAKIAAGTLGVDIVLDRRMRETNLGDAEGLTGEEINARFGAGTLEAWRHSSADNPQVSQHFRFPNGESKVEHLERTLNALEAFLNKTPHVRVGVASHGGAMRRLLHHFCPELPSPIFVENCVVYKTYFQPKGRVWRVERDPVSSSRG